MDVGHLGCADGAQLGHGQRFNRGRVAGGRLGSGERLGAHEEDARGGAGELGGDVGRATEDGLDAHQRTVGLFELDDVGDHGSVQLDRQAGGSVTAVVAGAEQDGVGCVSGDRLGHGRCERRAGQTAGQVAGRQHLRGAMGAQRGCDGVAGAPNDRNDRVGKLGGLGQQLQGGGGGLAMALFGLGEVGVDPDG